MKPTSTDLVDRLETAVLPEKEPYCFFPSGASRGGLTPKELSPFLSATTLLFMLSCGMFTTTNKSFSCNSCCGGHRGSKTRQSVFVCELFAFKLVPCRWRKTNRDKLQQWLTTTPIFISENPKSEANPCS
ncbi:unnamed protein product [Prunus armeniaca]|uniref:Uncharacterized protein n=1 Tax=Prunus armeniaca TaxID=36596 RepID=A0A6J5TP15_PRUAR|nr:unnamed protein product [Prunus armeniaca]